MTPKSARPYVCACQQHSFTGEVDLKQREAYGWCKNYFLKAKLGFKKSSKKSFSISDNNLGI